MIPKKIHYCWFGEGEIPEKDKKCIDSWKRYCPDYEIILWNEKNYDISTNRYMAEAYQAKKWGFVPDYARLDIIYNNGGIYLDTDVEIISSFDNLLNNKGFAGFESDQYIALGLGFGAEKNNRLIKKLRDQYCDKYFIQPDGSLNQTGSPVYSSQVFEGEGFVMNGKEQSIGGFRVYPTEYFCPMDYKTGVTSITENTKSIHWYNASWFSDVMKKDLAKQRQFNRVLGIALGGFAFKCYKYFVNPKRLLLRLLNKDDVYPKESVEGMQRIRHGEK